MRRLLLATVWSLTALLVAPSFVAASEPSQTIRQERDTRKQRALLLTLLGAHEYSPSLRVLKRIGTERELTRQLIYISGWKRYRSVIRVRALATLALFPTDDVYKYLLSVVHERDNVGHTLGLLLRKQALRSLGRGFGNRAISDLVAVRSDPNAQIREGVAQGLGDTRSSAAIVHLEAWLPNEKELFVRVAIDNALEIVRKARR